jgi:hypothetical protein
MKAELIAASVAHRVLSGRSTKVRCLTASQSGCGRQAELRAQLIPFWRAVSAEKNQNHISQTRAEHPAQFYASVKRASD